MVTVSIFYVEFGGNNFFFFFLNDKANQNNRKKEKKRERESFLSIMMFVNRLYPNNYRHTQICVHACTHPCTHVHTHTHTHVFLMYPVSNYMNNLYGHKEQVWSEIENIYNLTRESM